QKVQRYPVEWMSALERMATLGAEWLSPGHGYAIHAREAVHAVLMNTARYLQIIIDQVLTRMNAGQAPEEIFHAVDADPDLSRLPCLLPRHDHPKFIVRNLLRQWGGWWNGNAADLLPATWEMQAREIVSLAGASRRSWRAVSASWSREKRRSPRTSPNGSRAPIPRTAADSA